MRGPSFFLWKRVSSLSDRIGQHAAAFPLIFRISLPAAAGNEIQARQERIKLLRRASALSGSKSDAESCIKLSVQKSSSKPIFKMYICASFAFFRPRRKKKSFSSHAWMQPAHLNAWWCVKSKFMLTFHTSGRGYFASHTLESSRQLQVMVFVAILSLKPDFTTHANQWISFSCLPGKTWPRKLVETWIWWLTYARWEIPYF